MLPRRYTTHVRPTPSAPEVSEARFKRFMRELGGYERKLTFGRTMDALLDLYSSWRRTGDPALKVRLVMLAFELHRLDPDFKCDLRFQETPGKKLVKAQGAQDA
jgi:hypothetical protein